MIRTLFLLASLASLIASILMGRARFDQQFPNQPEYMFWVVATATVLTGMAVAVSIAQLVAAAWSTIADWWENGLEIRAARRETKRMEAMAEQETARIHIQAQQDAEAQRSVEESQRRGALPLWVRKSMRVLAVLGGLYSAYAGGVGFDALFVDPNASWVLHSLSFFITFVCNMVIVMVAFSFMEIAYAEGVRGFVGWGGVRRIAVLLLVIGFQLFGNMYMAVIGAAGDAARKAQARQEVAALSATTQQVDTFLQSEAQIKNVLDIYAGMFEEMGQRELASGVRTQSRGQGQVTTAFMTVGNQLAGLSAKFTEHQEGRAEQVKQINNILAGIRQELDSPENTTTFVKREAKIFHALQEARTALVELNAGSLAHTVRMVMEQSGSFAAAEASQNASLRDTQATALEEIRADAKRKADQLIAELKPFLEAKIVVPASEALDRGEAVNRHWRVARPAVATIAIAEFDWLLYFLVCLISAQRLTDKRRENEPTAVVVPIHAVPPPPAEPSASAGEGAAPAPGAPSPTRRATAGWKDRLGGGT